MSDARHLHARRACACEANRGRRRRRCAHAYRPPSRTMASLLRLRLQAPARARRHTHAHARYNPMVLVVRLALLLPALHLLGPIAAEYDSPFNEFDSDVKCASGHDPIALPVTGLGSMRGDMCLPAGCNPGNETNPAGTGCPTGPEHTFPMCVLKRKDGASGPAGGDACALACTVPAGDATCPNGDDASDCKCPSGAICLPQVADAKRGFCVFVREPDKKCPGCDANCAAACTADCQKDEECAAVGIKNLLAHVAEHCAGIRDLSHHHHAGTSCPSNYQDVRPV
jgi:hypothetical protein